MESGDELLVTHLVTTREACRLDVAVRQASLLTICTPGVDYDG